MTVYIDPPTWPGHGRLWSHLVSDESYAELHAFAGRLGIPERAFERDHYDVIEERYASALAAGAVPVGSRELVRRLTAAGLRRRKISRLWPLASASAIEPTSSPTFRMTSSPSCTLAPRSSGFSPSTKGSA